MKNIFNYVMILGLSLVFISCGGGETTPKTADEIQKEIKEVVGDKKINAKIDLKKSMVHWKGTMMGMYSHTGLVDLTAGAVEINDGKLISGSFTVDMSSMRATDDNFDEKAGKTAKKLVGHLSGGDFFDIANNPKASFVITSVNGDVATGKLTVRGNTHEEHVKGITIKKDGNNFVMKGTLTFDRKKYKVAFDHPAKDMTLSNDIVLTVTLAAGV